MATYNLGQAAIVMKGVYAAGTAYLPLNCVTNDGGLWICKKACTGIEPGVANGWEEYWQPAASGIKEITITAASAGTATMVITFSDNTTTSFTYSTSDVADGSITNPKLALNSVGTNNLMNGSVTGDKIAPGAVSNSLTVTLAVASWANKEQTVTANGVTASNAVIISPTPENHQAYGEAQIRCTAQAANSLTFACEDVPATAITVNVCCINK